MAFVAMAHSRLGHQAQANAVLEAAIRLGDEWAHADNDSTAELRNGAGWYERVQNPIVVAEARSVIEAARLSAEAGTSPGQPPR
jgi:hypothetical protein